MSYRTSFFRLNHLEYHLLGGFHSTIAIALVGVVVSMPPLVQTAMATPPGPRVDNLDGTYHYSLPSGASTAPHWEDNLYYVYDGQANFAWTPTAPPVENLVDIQVQQPADGGLHGLVGSIAVDELGRRWVVSYVNVQGLLSKEALYDLEIGPEPTTASWSGPQQVGDAMGDETYHPLSWSYATCSFSYVAGMAQWWNTDTTTQSFLPTGPRDSVALLYGVDAVTAHEDNWEDMELNPTCTGFFVDEKTVVTSEFSPSAYCVAGSPAAAVPLRRRLGATCFSTPPSLLHRVPASLRRYGAS